MATTTGSHAQINVTPLIDVLLVLLIIFMVITPLSSHGLAVQVPPPADATAHDEPLPVLVVSIDALGVVRLNQEKVETPELPERLMRALASRAEKTVFVQGDAGLEYGAVASVIDVAKGAGAGRVALSTGPAARRE